MAIFFFLLGLEMKHHITEGEFQNKRNLLLPCIAAVGGFVVPALIYLAFNWNSTEGIVGWAIPVATDTAFVLAIISLIGSRIISSSIKVFVVGLSIIDDVLAVVVLALFYTPGLDIWWLLLCIIPLAFLATLNLRKSYNKYMYYVGGIILWILIVKSGVHGTISGILLALFVPTTIEMGDNKIHLVKEMESSIHSFVTFCVLPLFAFVNCELPLQEMVMKDAFSSISMGCFFGLLMGKPLGIFGSALLARHLGKISLPEGTNIIQFLGISCLCGIGFTLSIFIGLLAFDPTALENQMKLGVLLSSLFSAIIGTIIIIYEDARKNYSS